MRCNLNPIDSIRVSNSMIPPFSTIPGNLAVNRRKNLLLTMPKCTCKLDEKKRQMSVMNRSQRNITIQVGLR